MNQTGTGGLLRSALRKISKKNNKKRQKKNKTKKGKSATAAATFLTEFLPSFTEFSNGHNRVLLLDVAIGTSITSFNPLDYTERAAFFDWKKKDRGRVFLGSTGFVPSIFCFLLDFRTQRRTGVGWVEAGRFHRRRTRSTRVGMSLEMPMEPMEIGRKLNARGVPVAR